MCVWFDLSPFVDLDENGDPDKKDSDEETEEEKEAQKAAKARGTRSHHGWWPH